jgi:hypothetical protein
VRLSISGNIIRPEEGQLVERSVLRQSRTSRDATFGCHSDLAILKPGQIKGRSFVLGCVAVSQSDPAGGLPVTTAKPPARYGATRGRPSERLCFTYRLAPGRRPPITRARMAPAPATGCRAPWAIYRD